MLRNIYGFDDLGRKIKIGEYTVPDPVGGRIFYIDPESDETVEFYDTNGNIIQDVVAGDTPAYYKVINAGTSGKEKYYVYHEELYTDKVWTYYENGAWVNENTGFDSRDAGFGKFNTTGIMALHDGAYVTDDANGYATIWYQIQQHNLNQLNGCSDWYVGAQGDLSNLRSFINDKISTLGLVDLFTNQTIWTSSDTGINKYAQVWNGSYWTSYDRKNNYGVIPIRSF